MSEWISCSDTLPEHSGEYLTYNPSSVYLKVGVTTRFESEWENSNGFITHWMLLPEPPK